MEAELKISKDYTFIAMPKKLSYYLNVYQRCVYCTLLDYQQMKGSEKFEIAISYIAKNLDISKTKVQYTIDELIQLNLINKAFKIGEKSTYSINKEKIKEFDLLTSDEIFKLRETTNTYKATRKTPTKKIKSNVDDTIVSLPIQEPIKFIPIIQPVQAPVQPTAKQISKEYQPESFIIEEEEEEEEEEEDSEEETEVESIYIDSDEIDNTVLIDKFEHYILTNNDRKYPYTDETFPHIPDNFTFEEIKILKDNIGNMEKIGKMIGMKRRTERDLKDFSRFPAEKIKVLEPNF